MAYKICPECNLNYISEEEIICEVCRGKHSERVKVRGANRKKAEEKVYPRKNVAFKCNFCDGGASESCVGFHGICSDSMIRNNIQVEKRVWCSAPECDCCKYLNGQIDRAQLDAAWQKNAGNVCYESGVLTLWKMAAGMVVRGKNKGQPNKLLGVQTNSLCVLTSRKVKAKKEERFIFGAFIVARSDEGSDVSAGEVQAHDKYKISLTPEESKELNFWNYYKNNSEKAPYQWGTGLFRYIGDDASVKILQDIAKVKRGKADEALAKEMLEYFTEANGLNK